MPVDVDVEELDATVFDHAGWKASAGGLLKLTVTEPDPDLAVEPWPTRLEEWKTRPTLVARVSLHDAFSMPSVLVFQADDVRDWLAKVGAKNVTALAIVRYGDQHHLHVTEIVQRPDSRSGPQSLVDYAAATVVTAPRVIVLEDADWPACLNNPVYAADSGATLPHYSI